MHLTIRKAALLAAMICFAWTGLVSAVRADVKDYEFQLVQSELKKGDSVIAACGCH